MSDLEESPYKASTLAKIQKILDVLREDKELSGGTLEDAIKLALPRNQLSLVAARLHQEYVAPVLEEYGDLTLFGGNMEEKSKLFSYLRELQHQLLSARPHRM
jgi:hypothetical protein